MENTLQGIVLRLVKGTPITPQEEDNNWILATTFVNALAAFFGISLNPDGTLKNGALNNIAQIANLSTFADAFNANGSLPVGTYTGSAGPPVTGAYSVTQPAIMALAAGQLIRFKADTANPGTATVTINALPPANLFKNGTIALAPGDILLGDVISALYDGTNFQLLALQRTATSAASGSVLLASASEVLAAVDAAKAVTSATLQAHPGVAKAWVKFSATAGVVTVLANYNVSGVVRTSAGLYTISFTRPFSSANFACSVSAKVFTGDSAIIPFISGTDTGVAGSKIIETKNVAGTSRDSDEVYFEAWGTQ